MCNRLDLHKIQILILIMIETYFVKINCGLTFVTYLWIQILLCIIWRIKPLRLINTKWFLNSICQTRVLWARTFIWETDSFNNKKNRSYIHVIICKKKKNPAFSCRKKYRYVYFKKLHCKKKWRKKISTPFHVTKRTPIQTSANASTYISLSFHTL